LTQNARSQHQNKFGDIKCAYRGENGMMCAAGCLLTDEQAQRAGEGIGWQQICKLHQDINDLYSGSEKIIMELQYVHDIVLVSEWTSSLRGIASRYCLDHSILYKSPNNS